MYFYTSHLTIRKVCIIIITMAMGIRVPSTFSMMRLWDRNVFIWHVRIFRNGLDSDNLLFNDSEADFRCNKLPINT